MILESCPKHVEYLPLCHLVRETGLMYITVIYRNRAVADTLLEKNAGFQSGVRTLCDDIAKNGLCVSEVLALLTGTTRMLLDPSAEALSSADPNVRPGMTVSVPVLYRYTLAKVAGEFMTLTTIAEKLGVHPIAIERLCGSWLVNIGGESLDVGLGVHGYLSGKHAVRMFCGDKLDGTDSFWNTARVTKFVRDDIVEYVGKLQAAGLWYVFVSEVQPGVVGAGGGTGSGPRRHVLDPRHKKCVTALMTWVQSREHMRHAFIGLDSECSLLPATMLGSVQDELKSRLDDPNRVGVPMKLVSCTDTSSLRKGELRLLSTVCVLKQYLGMSSKVAERCATVIGLTKRRGSAFAWLFMHHDTRLKGKDNGIIRLIRIQDLALLSGDESWWLRCVGSVCV